LILSSFTTVFLFYLHGWCATPTLSSWANRFSNFLLNLIYITYIISTASCNVCFFVWHVTRQKRFLKFRATKGNAKQQINLHKYVSEIVFTSMQSRTPAQKPENVQTWKCSWLLVVGLTKFLTLLPYKPNIDPRLHNGFKAKEKSVHFYDFGLTMPVMYRDNTMRS